MRRRSAASASWARVDAFSFTSSCWRAISHSAGVTTGGAFNRRSVICHLLQQARCCHEDDCARPKRYGYAIRIEKRSAGPHCLSRRFRAEEQELLVVVRGIDGDAFDDGAVG